MNRKTARDFDPRVLELFDDYVHGRLSRRGFLEGASRFVVAGVAAESLLLALRPDFAVGEQVPANDARLKATYEQFPSPEGYGTLRGYLVRPAKPKGKLPTVLVVHENRGLNPHIEDIARRLALDNFVAFAPDALFPLGGYPGDEDKARELFSKLDQTKTHADFLAAVEVLKKLPGGNGKVGVVGFCYGGGIANFLATRVADLGAAVPFYGAQPSAEDAARIRAPLLLHYAGNDQRITSGWPAFEAQLQSAKVEYQAFIYPGVEHGFNNDTTPRYDAAAAKLAWERTVSFFDKHLRT
jgi:carboxymethylenebutenolidase